MKKKALCSNCGMAECFPDKSSWCWNEQVYGGGGGGVKCKVL